MSPARTPPAPGRPVQGGGTPRNIDPVPAGITNTLSGTAHGPVIQASRIDTVTVHHNHHSAAPVIPWQLPLAVRTLVNRVDTRASLDRALLGEDEHHTGTRPAGTPVVVVLHGPAGVGTTALAVRWLHDHADRYPDGALYAHLGDRPVLGVSDPEPVVTGWLLDLGVQAVDLPPTPDQRLARYRSLTRTRALTVLLDDVRDTTHVVPLLPTGPECVVVVTARTPLSSLRQFGAHLLHVSPLNAQHSLAILSEITGADRIDDAPEAATSLVRACGGIPRALIALAGIAASDPTLPLTALATRYQHRPSTTSTSPGDSTVLHALAQARDGLRPPERRLFGILAALPHREYDLATIETAALTDLHPEPHDASPASVRSPGERAGDITDMLNQLGQAGLLTSHPVSDAVGLDGTISGARWAMDHLARDTGRTPTRVEDGQERAAAVVRVADLVWRVLHDADRAVTGYRRHPHRHPSGPPGPELFGDRGQALTWLETHGRTVGAYAYTLVDLGQHERAWHMVDGLWPLFLHLKHYAWRTDMHSCGLAAAQAWGDPEAQAEMRKRLGMDARSAGRHDDAEREFHAALALRESLADRRGVADVRMMLARLHIDIAEHTDHSDGHPPAQARQRRTEALRRAEHELLLALQVYRDTGARRELALTLHLLGEHAGTQGAHEEALGLLKSAATRFNALTNPDPYNAARTHAAIGRTFTRLGRYRLATQHLTEAWQRLRELGSAGEQARVLTYQAELAAATGDLATHDALLAEAQERRDAHS
ncbi:NB-ARC domain-containing protein [Umezawaea sp. Da 62-37]|uniref:NB-ARC domain-containing protein n=1 Tax=Umezawaea sp. Da 62-37 TaxID=3075927 RepID=UPI0028F6DF31|nr:NB-ARC domain-containing protein [Umezawaea sp. Da 62-37]WNV85023.1 tetratricopeptide repeat protein [Umezawaea sp. Da 62-37]